MKSDYYVHFNGAAVFVKEGEYFTSQGGKVQKWGEHWLKVQASSIGEARRIGAVIFGVKLSWLYSDEE